MEPDDTPAKDPHEPSAVERISESSAKSSEKNVEPPRRLIAPRVVLLLLGLVVCASAWFVSIFAGHDVFFSANHVLYFEPLSCFVGEALREGRIPLWNPYCYSGMSQIANLTPSPFYPFTALFAVLDYNHAVALSIVIHELIGLGGTYLLLRMISATLPSASETSSGDSNADSAGSGAGSTRSGRVERATNYSRLACLTGALVFMLCGCLQPGAANFTIAATAAWIPWCLWAQLRLQRASGRAALAGAVAVLSIVAAMNMLAGCIELSMLTMGIVKFNVILDAVKRFRAGEPWFHNALRQWCALFLGTLIAAPALLPAAEWLLDKLQYPISVATANRADVITTLLGFLYPTNQHRFTLFASLLVDGKGTGELLAVDHVITCFGPIVLALAAFGLSGGTLYSKGTGAKKNSEATKNADTAEEQLASRAAQHRRFLLGAVIVGTAALCLVSLRTLDLPLARFLPSAFLCHPSAPFMVLLSLAIALAVTEGVSAIEFPKPLYSLILVVLSLVPCSFFNVDGFCTTRRDGITGNTMRQAVDKELQNARVAISPRWAIPALVSGPNEQMETYTVGKEANRNINQKLLNAYGYQATPSAVYQYVIVGKKFFHPASIQTLTGASMVAVPKRGDYPSKYPEADIERFASSFHASGFHRCSATINWVWKDSPAQALDAVRDEKFISNPSFIERNTAQGKDTEKLQQLPSGLLNPPSEAPSASPEKETLTREELRRRYKTDKELSEAIESLALHGRVEVMRSEPEHVVVSVELDKPAFVILTDAFYPGWKVSIDAIPTICYRANGIDRAVFVDKGSHLVQFDFKPDSYALGLKCFVMGLAVIFYLAIWSIARLIVKTIRFLSFGVWEE